MVCVVYRDADDCVECESLLELIHVGPPHVLGTVEAAVRHTAHIHREGGMSEKEGGVGIAGR